MIVQCIVVLLLQFSGARCAHTCGYQARWTQSGYSGLDGPLHDKTLFYKTSQMQMERKKEDVMSRLNNLNIEKIANPILESIDLTSSEVKQAPIGLDYNSGIFTSPSTGKFLVTLTAQLFISDNDKLISYAQLFILKNKKLVSTENYLLVKMHEVADLRREFELNQGDTLEVFVGFHTESKQAGRWNHQGFFLEDVRFCIFW